LRKSRWEPFLALRKLRFFHCGTSKPLSYARFAQCPSLPNLEELTIGDIQAGDPLLAAGPACGNFEA